MQPQPIIYTTRYTSPCGVLILGALGNQICLCDWLREKRGELVTNRLKRLLRAEMVEGSAPILDEAVRQLDEFFAQKRKSFDLPLLFVGTDLQKAVWHELQKIPFGQTISYAEMARRIGNPKAVRAVANANGANAMAVIVPCHRVVGSDGSLTGFAGGITAKRFLLDLER